MGIKTITVHLGLVQASLLGVVLLISGAILTGTAFFFEWYNGEHSWLNAFLLAIPVVILFVLTKFNKLYFLSKEYASSKRQNAIGEKIVSFSTHNPQWIMLVTQTFNLMSILLLMSKFLL
jgi:hypothetical protein